MTNKYDYLILRIVKFAQDYPLELRLTYTDGVPDDVLELHTKVKETGRGYLRFDELGVLGFRIALHKKDAGDEYLVMERGHYAGPSLDLSAFE